MKALTLSLVVVLTSAPAAFAADATAQPTLTLEGAERAVAAAIYARAHGAPGAVVAVVAAGGTHPLPGAFRRHLRGQHGRVHRQDEQRRNFGQPTGGVEDSVNENRPRITAETQVHGQFITSEGKRLHSPNDLVYRSDGTLCFTDPPFGLPKFVDDPRKELPLSGVYSRNDDRLRLDTRELKGPAAIVFPPLLPGIRP